MQAITDACWNDNLDATPCVASSDNFDWQAWARAGDVMNGNKRIYDLNSQMKKISQEQLCFL